jgi:rhodanese-related sulfurtransferase
MYKKILILFLTLGFVGSANAEILKGRISTVSKKAGTIQINIKDKGPAVVRVGTDTIFEGTKGIKELSPPDLIEVDQEPGKTAKRIKKIIFALPPGVEISLEELLSIMNSGDKYYLFDARPAKRFGGGHIPTSVTAFPKDKNFLNLLPEDKTALVVFFCGGPTCPYTGKAVAKAQKAGYTNLKGFQAGMPAWKKAKLPVYSEPKWLSKNLNTQHIILDVRDTGVSSKSHIKGGVAMPVAELQAMTQGFIKSKKVPYLPNVTDKRAPVIVYADSHTSDAAVKGFNELRLWGYKGATILNGGFDGWQSAGLPTATGAAATKIIYEKKLAPGAIAPEKFAALEKARDNVLFIDVRTDKEASTGVLKGAQHIPLDKLADATASLPKDKEIILYCANGIRAQMGYEMLNKLGFKTRFLNETITVDKDGNYKL